MARVIMDLQNEWAVQSLVLFSFALQVFLLMAAGIRRRNVPLVPRMLLWLAYQLADSTALFTLGHLSISSRLDQHQLVAFWAPFLLVHLGGQDNITAYAFEDNQLWLRHLQTLVVQVLGAAYVLYKYLPGSETLMLMAAILMFVVGVLKYGERIWALRCASFECMWSALEKSDASDPLERTDYLLRRWLLLYDTAEEGIDTEERILLTAHSLLDLCKALFVGVGPRRVQLQHAGSLVSELFFAKELDSLMEMELSLMYDIMYTKVAVIPTWYGLCIRVVSLVATVVAFLLFQFSSKDAHNTIDVAISYVLLGGALVLEIISSLRAIGSTWTCAFLYARARRWRQLHKVLLCLRRLVKAGTGSQRGWSGYVGQYNLFESCSHDSREVTGKMARLIGLGLDNWWNEVHHSGLARISESTRMLVLGKIVSMMRSESEEDTGQERFTTAGSYTPGQHTIRRYGLEEDISWSIGDQMGFEDSIIAWHVATEMLLFKFRRDDSDTSSEGIIRRSDYNRDHEEAIKLLSNYMMYLLVMRPYMLPGPVRLSRHVQARDDLYNIVRHGGSAEGATPQERLEWAMKIANYSTLPAAAGRNNIGDEKTAYGSGVELAVRLLSVKPQPSLQTMLGVMFGVWVEMLRYVAVTCHRESHARQLSHGGEFLSIVWLMSGHMDLFRAQGLT